MPSPFVILLFQKTQSENTNFLHKGMLVFLLVLYVFYVIRMHWLDFTSHNSVSMKFTSEQSASNAAVNGKTPHFNIVAIFIGEDGA